MPTWLKAYKQNEKKVSCLFGEHLLKRYPSNPVAIVEAPKTAIYGSLYFGLPNNPNNFLWLAAYSLTSLNYEKVKVLEGRKIYLFPDLGAFKLWSQKAKEFNNLVPGTSFEVDDLLEKNASEAERKGGLDLADYLIRFSKFSIKLTKEPEHIIIPNYEEQALIKHVRGMHLLFDCDLVFLIHSFILSFYL